MVQFQELEEYLDNLALSQQHRRELPEEEPKQGT
jgi:hypothetical protein